MGYEDYFIYNKTIFKTGDFVEGIINNINISDARIYIKTSMLSNDIIVYLCQNIISGCNSSPDHFGYKFAWSFLADRTNELHLKKVIKDCFESIIDLSFPKR
jgi:hypothetical protein